MFSVYYLRNTQLRCTSCLSYVSRFKELNPETLREIVWTAFHERKLVRRFPSLHVDFVIVRSVSFDQLRSQIYHNLINRMPLPYTQRKLAKLSLNHC